VERGDKEGLRCQLERRSVSFRLQHFFLADISLSALIARIKQVCNFPSDSESERIVSGLRWIGMFSAEKVVVRSGNLLDTLCGRLEGLMKYEQGERDLVMLQHKFIVEWKDGKEVIIRALFSILVLIIWEYRKPSLRLSRRTARPTAILQWHSRSAYRAVSLLSWFWTVC
jgi:hypothetical protein